MFSVNNWAVLSDVEYSIMCNAVLNIHVIFLWKGAHTFGLCSHADGR